LFRFVPFIVDPNATVSRIRVRIIFGKSDPDPHQSQKLDLYPHRSEKQDSDPHQIQNSGAVEAQNRAMEGHEEQDLDSH
jgi:hypothetical protein